MLHALPAVELLARYAAHELSPVEVVRSVLARIEQCEPTIAALWALDADAALAAARASEARWRDGRAMNNLAP